MNISTTALKNLPVNDSSMRTLVIYECFVINLCLHTFRSEFKVTVSHCMKSRHHTYINTLQQKGIGLNSKNSGKNCYF